MRIDVRSIVKRIDAKLTALQRDQLPFATALALTRTAQIVQKAEIENIKSVFPTATPFTQRGIGMKPARKNDLDAVVFVKDVQAVYLAPYEFGGKSIPAGPSDQAMLVPKGIGVNQYGNIPYKKVQKLLANKDKYFIGAVTTKAGTVSGLWQRTNTKVSSNVVFSKKKNAFRRAGSVKQKGLKLLVRFTDPRDVKQNLGYHELAEKLVMKNFSLELKKALRVALASAK